MDLQTIGIAIAKLRKAVESINTDIAILIKRSGDHEQRLLKLELMRKPVDAIAEQRMAVEEALGFGDPVLPYDTDHYSTARDSVFVSDEAAYGPLKKRNEP